MAPNERRRKSPYWAALFAEAESFSDQAAAWAEMLDAVECDGDEGDWEPLAERDVRDPHDVPGDPRDDDM